eukprot:457597_1
MSPFAFTLLLIGAVNCVFAATNGTVNGTNIFATDVITRILKFVPLPQKLMRISDEQKPTHLTIDSEEDLDLFIGWLAVFCDVDDKDKHLVDERFKTYWKMFTQQTKDKIKAKIFNSTVATCTKFDGYLLIDMDRPDIMSRIKSKSFLYELFPHNCTLTNPNASFDYFGDYLDSLYRVSNFSNLTIPNIPTYVQNMEDIIDYLVATHGTKASSALEQLSYEFRYILTHQSLVDFLINPYPSIINAFVEKWYQMTSFVFAYPDRDYAPWQFIHDDQLKTTVIRNSRRYSHMERDNLTMDYVERFIVFCDVNATDKPLVEEWFKSEWNLFSNQTKETVKMQIKNLNISNNFDEYLLMGMDDDADIIERIQSKAFIYESNPSGSMFTNANGTDPEVFARLLTDVRDEVNDSSAAITNHYKNGKAVIEYLIAMNGKNACTSRVLGAIHREFVFMLQHKAAVDANINLNPAVVNDFVQYWCARTSLRFEYRYYYEIPWQHIQNDALKRTIIINSWKLTNDRE